MCILDVTERYGSKIAQKQTNNGFACRVFLKTYPFDIEINWVDAGMQIFLSGFEHGLSNHELFYKLQWGSRCLQVHCKTQIQFHTPIKHFFVQ